MVILASQSPRRKTLFKKICSNFKIINPDINEKLENNNINSYSYELSKLKAYKVFSLFPNDQILAADTIVVIKNKILNKPIDKNDAKKMLKMLSNKKHEVITSYTYIDKNVEINRNIKSIVYMNKLSDKLINEYISKGYSDGKAGAYGIQDPYPLVNKVIGSINNVIGLPIEDIKKDLSKHNVRLN